jgi:hypothetical protein
MSVVTLLPQIDCLCGVRIRDGCMGTWIESPNSLVSFTLTTESLLVALPDQST